MENLFSLLASQLLPRVTEPKFKRYRIGQTGCTTLLLSGSPRFHIHVTADGEQAHFFEAETGGVRYGLIAVELTAPLSLAKTEKLLVHYLTRIRKPFDIACNVSMEIDRCSGAVYSTDYWQDESGTDWKVRGATDGKMLAVLYVKNIAAAPVHEHDAFLNGFRFSALR